MNNPQSSPAPTPVPPAVPPDTERRQPMGVVAALLKEPGQVADAVAEGRGLAAMAFALLGLAVACHAVFGLAFGLFAGWRVALMDVAKAPLIALASLVLCFPSLYVFASVGGTPLTLKQTFALGCAWLAMVGLLLIGLAPVAWLFAVSTQSAPFVVMLTFLIWIIAVVFAIRFLGKLRAQPLFQRQGGIRFWLVILVLVTLQMTTFLRPMLASPEKGWRTPAKMFFLSHFGSTFERKK